MRKQFCFKQSLLLVANLWRVSSLKSLPKSDLTCRSDQKGLSLTPVRFDIKRNLGWAGDLSGNTLFGGPVLTLKLRANYDSFCDFLNRSAVFIFVYYSVYMLYDKQTELIQDTFQMFSFFEIAIVQLEHRTVSREAIHPGIKPPCCEICRLPLTSTQLLSNF